jgi:hypothetical protein
MSGRLPAALPRVKEPLVPIGYEAGWAPEPAWTRLWGGKFSVPAPTGTLTCDHPSRSPTLYHWAILASSVGVCAFVTVMSHRRHLNVINGILSLINSGFFYWGSYESRIFGFIYGIHWSNILTKPSRTANKAWPSSFGVGRRTNNSSSYTSSLLRNVTQDLE